MPRRSPPNGNRGSKLDANSFAILLLGNTGRLERDSLPFSVLFEVHSRKSGLTADVITLELAFLGGSTGEHSRISVDAHLNIVILQLIVLEVAGLNGFQDLRLRKELAGDIDNGVVIRRHSIEGRGVAL